MITSCAILQPHYLPWIGYFELINRVDKFIFLDDVKFIKREWKNRNKIRKSHTSDDFKWLSVPIKKKYQDSNINNAFIDDTHPWRIDHINNLNSVYKKSKYFDQYIDYIKHPILDKKNDTLSKLNIKLITNICDILQIKYNFYLSSEFKVLSNREYKLRDLCILTDSKLLVANNATQNYVDKSFFREKEIDFITQDYVHPKYTQKYNNDILKFLSNLSIVDLLFNYGLKSFDIIINNK